MSATKVRFMTKRLVEKAKLLSTAGDMKTAMEIEGQICKIANRIRRDRFGRTDEEMLAGIEEMEERHRGTHVFCESTRLSIEQRKLALLKRIEAKRASA